MASRECTHCGLSKPLSAEWWVKNSTKRDGFDVCCKECTNARRRAARAASPRIKASERAYRVANRDRVLSWGRGHRQRNADQINERRRTRLALDEDYRRRRHAQKRDSYHGLAPGQYDAMSQAQDGRCAICRVRPDALLVDHDHTTGMVRQLLCHGCNTGIGLLGEDISRLLAAIAYLEVHASEPAWWIQAPESSSSNVRAG